MSPHTQHNRTHAHHAHRRSQPHHPHAPTYESRHIGRQTLAEHHQSSWPVSAGMHNPTHQPTNPVTKASNHRDPHDTTYATRRITYPVSARPAACERILTRVDGASLPVGQGCGVRSHPCTGETVNRHGSSVIPGYCLVMREPIPIRRGEHQSGVRVRPPPAWAITKIRNPAHQSVRGVFVTRQGVGRLIPGRLIPVPGQAVTRTGIRRKAWTRWRNSGTVSQASNPWTGSRTASSVTRPTRKQPACQPAREQRTQLSGFNPADCLQTADPQTTSPT